MVGGSPTWAARSATLDFRAKSRRRRRGGRGRWVRGHERDRQNNNCDRDDAEPEYQPVGVNPDARVSAARDSDWKERR